MLIIGELFSNLLVLAVLFVGGLLYVGLEWLFKKVRGATYK